MAYKTDEKHYQKKHLFYHENLTVHTYSDGTTKQSKDIEPRSAIICAAIAGGCFVFATILSCFTMVGTGEVGVVTRFGEVKRTVGSGIHLKLPIESVVKMNTRVQKIEVKTDAATRDLQEVNGSLAVNFSVTTEDALAIYRQLGVDYSLNIIEPILHESFKQGISGYTAEALMAHRTEVKETIQGMLQQRLSGYGIIVVDANLTDLNFSDAFNAAIEQKAVAQQETERANQELERVKIEAESKIEQARAEAEAQRLQQQTLSELIIKKMAIEKWNGSLPSVMSDSTIIKDLISN